MKTIAIVNKNQLDFDQVEKFILPLLYRDIAVEEKDKIKEEINNYLWSMIEPYVIFREVDENDLLTEVCTQLMKPFADKSPDQVFYHTEGSYSFPKRYLEVIHCQPLWKDYLLAQKENINAIACLFSLKHIVIENTCIIIANKYDLAAPYFAKIDSITKEDILKVMRRRFYFSAILVRKDEMIKYYYQNPAYLVSKIFHLGDKDSIQKLSFSHLKYNLVYYFKQDNKESINQIATRINGSHAVRGDVLILHELEENIYANLSIHEVKRLNVLSYGRLYDRQLKEEENYTLPTTELTENGQEITKKTVPYWSRYLVIERRMIHWRKNKNKCINCCQELETPIICEKCFRVRFCSITCQKEFKWYHDDECIQHN